MNNLVKGFGLLIAALVLGCVVSIVAGVFLMLGWNYGVVEVFDGVRRMSVWTAMLTSLAVGSLGGSWRGASTRKKEGG